MTSQGFQRVLNTIRSLPRPENPSVEQMRESMEQNARAMRVDDDVQCTSVDAGGLSAEWVAKKDYEGDDTILYLHGGGYVMGSIATHRHLAGLIAKASDARGLIIDYRMGPEHPFPAAVEDATAAYRWILEQGIAPERIAIAGDSAGGGLTIAALVSLRDAGDPLPAAAACLSPWVDLAATGDSMVSKADEDPMVTKEGIVGFAKMYLDGQDPKSPLASPIYADLAGLPPILIQVGTAETLLDDSRRLADAARSAGVEVTLDEWDEMIHVWQYYAPIVPEGAEAVAKIGAFVRSRFDLVSQRAS